jgi:hypothetical protein
MPFQICREGTTAWLDLDLELDIEEVAYGGRRRPPQTAPVPACDR